MVSERASKECRVPREKELRAIADEVCRVLNDAKYLFRSLSKENYRFWEKGDGNPVTDIDLQLDRFLRHALMEILPAAGWLSEETQDNQVRMGKRRVWIVDPLDGTREFVNNVPEFGISVALVENGQVVVGAILFPELDEVYVAVEGQGARKNGVRVHVSPATSLEGQRVLVSRREHEAGRFASIAEGPQHIEPRGSMVYKLSRVADGYAVGTFTGEVRHEWDFAAGVLLVQEAGGRVTDAGGRWLAFNRYPPAQLGLVVSNGQLHPEIAQLCVAYDK